MLLETIRMVADALANNTIGVNAQLATLTVDAGDALPASIVTVADETRNGQVAVGRYPTTLPCLTVTLNGQVELDGEVVSSYRDAEVSILIRFVTQDADTAQGNTNAYYTLRAVVKALREFNRNTNESLRSRNGIHVLECKSLTHVQLFENIDDAYVTGGIEVTFHVRDTTP
jgi:hypothetical protein